MGEQVISKNTKQRGIKKQGDKIIVMNLPEGQSFKGELQGLIRDRRNKRGWITKKQETEWKTEGAKGQGTGDGNGEEYGIGSGVRKQKRPRSQKTEMDGGSRKKGDRNRVKREKKGKGQKSKGSKVKGKHREKIK